MEAASDILMAEERKPVRWADYDYSNAGAYFVTINAKGSGMPDPFGRIVDGAIVPAAAGLIAERCLQEIPDHFPMVTVDTSVVMPDHVHVILIISSETERSERIPANRPFETVPLVVGAYKSAVSRLVRQTAIPSFQWQKSYHDHIVRDDGELERIHAYITANPRRWWETHGQDRGDRS